MNDTERWSDEASQEFAQGGQQGFDVVGMLKRRKWWIIVLTILGLGAGYAYYELAPPTYESFAQLIIIRRQAELPTDPFAQRGRGEHTVGGDDLATQAELIGSVQNLARAMEKYELDQLASLKDEEHPLKEILDNLQISVGGRGLEDASVVNLSFRSIYQSDSQKVLAGIISAYSDYLGQSFKREGNEMLTLISQAKDTLEKQLNELNAKYRQFRVETTAIWNSRDESTGFVGTAAEHKLIALESKIADLDTERLLNQSRMETLTQAMQNGMDPEAVMMWMQRSGSITDLKAQKQDDIRENKLLPLMEEEQELMASLGEGHPKVLAVRKKLDLFKQMFKESASFAEGNQEEEEAAGEERRKNEYVTKYLHSLDHEIKEQQAQLSKLLAVAQSEREGIKKVTEAQLAIRDLEDQIKRVKDLYDAVVKRVSETELIKNYGGMSAEIITPPALGLQVAPKIFFALLIGGGFGFGLGFGMAFLLDKADRSFRGPEQIRSQLGLPVIGHIPVIMSHEEIGDLGEGSLDQILCTYHLPRSRYAEAYRAVRTALYFSTQYREHNVIQITGPNKNDGKSTLAANLAICIAQSGKRVLLVDADFRRPTISRLFGLQNDVGLSSVIKGVAEVPDVVQPTPVENLSVMVCGPKPNNPAELLTSPRFKELIDLLRDQYDFVMFDSPPLLAVTDASVIAARVDGVLLGMQITKNGRTTAQEATEKLDAIGAKILGIVVNGVGWKRAYAYRYGGNFGSQSKFYQVGSDILQDGQGYIYGDGHEGDGPAGDALGGRAQSQVDRPATSGVAADQSIAAALEGLGSAPAPAPQEPTAEPPAARDPEEST